MNIYQNTSVSIVKVSKNDHISQLVYKFLNEEYDLKNRGYDFWQNRYEFDSLSDTIGYAIFSNQRIVGFLGTISKVKGVVGLSVWFVLEEFRSYSLLLLTTVLKDITDLPIINSSPNPIALKIFQKMPGFEFRIEYIGIPKKLFRFSIKSRDAYPIIQRKRINIVYSDNVSIWDLVYNTLLYRKLCLALQPDKKEFVWSRKINILYRDIEYKFPLSIYGDVFE